jgi:hypothetical protein
VIRGFPQKIHAHENYCSCERSRQGVGLHYKGATKAQSFSVAGKFVECRHCENILFHKKKASLNNALSSLSGTEWLDRETSVLICANCSRIEWFFDDLQPKKS